MGEVSGYLFPFLIWNAAWDFKKRKISLLVTIIYLLLGILWNLKKVQLDWISLAGGIGIALFLLAMAWVTREQIGFGDGLIVLVCSLYLGFSKTMVLVMGGFCLTTVIGLAGMALKKAGRKTELPFVPFLLGAYLLLVVGECIVG